MLILSLQVTSPISPPSSSSFTKSKRLDLAEVSRLFAIIYACSTLFFTGISFKTQALYVTVFVARYLDLFHTWVSVYNFTMKLFFICSSVYILYLMKVRFRYVITLLLCLRITKPRCVPRATQTYERSVHRHVPCRVSRRPRIHSWTPLQLLLLHHRSLLVVLHLPRGRCHPPATFHRPTHR